MTDTNYREIYEKAYGPIPVDSKGRSYEIHHKDSNHQNNDPTNLVAVTIDEHYQIHLERGEINSANLIAHRASMPVIRLFGESNPFFGKKHKKEDMEKMVRNRRASGNGDYHHGHELWFKSEDSRQYHSKRMKENNPMKDPGICSKVQSKRVNTLKSFSYWKENQFNKLANSQIEDFVITNINNPQLAIRLRKEYKLKPDFSTSVANRFKAEYLSPQGGF